MKMQKAEFAHKLNKVKGVVPKKTNMPVLQGILVRDGYLIANNMEMTVKAKIEGTEGESFIIPERAFDLINNLPDGEVEISVSSNNIITIKADKIKNKYQTVPPEQFPAAVSQKEGSELTIKAETLLKSMTRVSYAVSALGNNPVMAAMCMQAGGGQLNFVGLAMTRSYTAPCITGYEIKVSRSDFLGDNKWHLYLQYCNELYFVVPVGLVTKDEIPENVGLIYYYPKTGKLLKKRRAVYRKIEEPVGVYKYIIYSRLDRERIPFYEGRAEYAKDYLADQREKRKIGRDFGSKMAKDLQDCQERLERLNNVEGQIEQLHKIEKILEKHQILGWRWYRNMDDALKDLDDALGSSYPKELGRVEDDLQRVLDNLRKIKENHSKEARGHADTSHRT